MDTIERENCSIQIFTIYTRMAESVRTHSIVGGQHRGRGGAKDELRANSLERLPLSPGITKEGARAWWAVSDVRWRYRHTMTGLDYRKSWSWIPYSGPAQ